MRSSTYLKIILLHCLLIFISGCSTTGDPQYYLLTSDTTLSTGNSSSNGEDGFLISVGPVTLPEYLDRSQIVTRSSDMKLDLADNHRWAEPLEENFTRVLAENLYGLVGTGKIVIFPAREYAPIKYRITVDVTRFDMSDQGEVLLIANWSVYDGNNKGLLKSQRKQYRLDIGSAAGYFEIVSAMSRTVNLLSRDISNTLNSFDR